jgi:hypothetical protein
MFLRSLAFARDDGHWPVTFAPLREIIRFSVAALPRWAFVVAVVRRQANLFFPAQSGKKRVLLSLKVYAAWANFPVAILIVSNQKRTHRGGAGHEKKFKNEQN